jgi:hypothetical protein
LSCSYNSEVNEVKTSQELVKTKILDVRVGATWEKVSFSASLHTQKTVTTITGKESKFTFAKGMCVIYRATIGFWSGGFELADNFRGMVTNGLAQQLDNDELYYQFIDLFGTHIIGQMDAGAKTVVQSEFTKENWAKTTESQRKIGAEASFGVFTGSVSSETQKKNAQAFEQQRSSYQNHVIGALPTDTGGDFYAWAERADKDPVPVKYSLTQISDIFDFRFFPDVSNIKAVKTKLESILKQYCAHRKGCKPNW